MRGRLFIFGIAATVIVCHLSAVEGSCGDRMPHSGYAAFGENKVSSGKLLSVSGTKIKLDVGEYPLVLSNLKVCIAGLWLNDWARLELNSHVSVIRSKDTNTVTEVYQPGAYLTVQDGSFVLKFPECKKFETPEKSQTSKRQ